MNRVVAAFGRAPVVLPVIHPVSRETALRSVDVCHGAGVPGVFLIDQGLDEAGVLALIRDVRARHPGLWVGVNLLTRRPADALAAALDACDGRIDGLWSDNAGVDERATEQPRAAELVAVRQARGWDGLYFGGVAFKYQREVPFAALGEAARRAAPYVDVLCTSGPGTGQAADPDKIRAIRAGAGDTAVAIASGITADNVGAYTAHAHAFLVGTGIESALGVIDAAELARLVRAIG